MDIDRDTLIWIYTKMETIRRFEIRAGELVQERKLISVVHQYAGEEAIACGVCANLRSRDYITSTHRGHGHLIAKGGELDKMMAELYGKSTGYCKGKGGSMHIADIDLGILGANGIVGAGLPVAVGAAFTAKYKKSDDVVVAFFGDGASNIGTFHEAINMASVWKLPVIFVCENNGYALTTSQERHQAIRDIADRAAAYAIPGVAIDGNDAFAVYEASKEAVKRARAGLGPTLLECKTYRWYGHTAADTNKEAFRSGEEVEAWKRKDPIPRFRQRLIEMGFLNQEEADKIVQGIVSAIEQSIRFAEESPAPSLDALMEDIYS